MLSAKIALPRGSSSFVKASAYQFLPTHFFLQFDNTQIALVFFCDNVVTLRSYLAGIFYELLLCKYFFIVLFLGKNEDVCKKSRNQQVGTILREPFGKNCFLYILQAKLVKNA